jgi:outer membrane lipoprotein-sorting protein
MSASRWACWLLLVCAFGASGHAQEKKAPLPPAATASAAPAQVTANGQQLTKRQAELVRQVNKYFNDLTLLSGSFVQTGADGKRQRGKFHMMRPGRFRFEFAPPSRVVIISDGKYMAIQDYDLNTDDRWDIGQTPFRALLQKDVDLLRDAVFTEVGETADMITIAFSDANSEGGSIKLFVATKPALQIKAWITKDNQSLDTRIDLTEVKIVDSIDQKLFDPASKLERLRW